MSAADLTEHRTLGRTGLRVSRIGLSGGYKAPAIAVDRAFHEYGINFFYWARRMPGMKQSLRKMVGSIRDRIVIAIQSYDPTGLWTRHSAEKALKELGTDYVDIFLLGYFNKMPRARVLEAAARLKEAGKIRFLGITSHNRRFHGELAQDETSPFDVQMIRYNAAHRGAERDVFENLPANKPGFVTYTATRWGQLLSEKKMPPGERPLTASECYRFALSHPAVDLCLAGPRTEAEMDGGLLALADGPLSDDDLARIRRIGDHVHG
jgi:aryl-alcohol dehydrogenase-like predicted oxidoreductase